MNINFKAITSGLFGGIIVKVENETTKCTIGESTGNFFLNTVDGVVLEVNIQDGDLDTAKELETLTEAEFALSSTAILDLEQLRDSLHNKVCVSKDNIRAISFFSSIYTTFKDFDTMDIKVGVLEDNTFVILGVDKTASVLIRATIKRK